MAQQDETLARAARRRDEQGLSYAGAVTPQEAYAILQANPRAKLIDVRTRAEIDWVGRPDVPPEQYALVEWNRYPGGVRNPEFLAELRAAAPADAPALLLCRSAARSKAAASAAAEAGFTQVYDILEGFEGDRDAAGHRKQVGGWCFHQLPWIGA
ncbi:rhodanese-like domain-containing protein [Chitinasiproducens palmae]|uniref:Rhodanese-related sulfurtransferase n=1 Tax=Chitinasiproducens palmae TaxID=1770053 RepID=A0A1H2PN48_9BURK|nr:rhodanese-like domain-containing protein [Chitinasiproducens palmae]SDV47592.1 Rhodanese-related sulfurtransferase [Chitinasiproducens palmae]